MGRPSPFVVSEHGAGTGALAAAMLGSLRESGSPLVGAIRYRPVEVEQARMDELRARLDGLGLSHLIAGDVGDGRTETGVVVANEVLDALPVHRVVGRPPGIGEQFVGLSDGQGLVAVEGPPSDDALAARLAVEGVRLNDGQVAEVCLGVDGWLADASAGLDRGLVVLIDYAEEPDTLYAPTRRDGTLRAFARHAVGGDPFRHVGRQDLTATVDLAAVRAAALAAGLEPVAETTQAELIAAAGSDAAASTLHRPGATIEDALLLRSALARLLDPRGMGGYRVLAYGRRLPANLDLPSLRRLGAAGR